MYSVPSVNAELAEDELPEVNLSTVPCLNP
jgi:hypothetical protein